MDLLKFRKPHEPMDFHLGQQSFDELNQGGVLGPDGQELLHMETGTKRYRMVPAQ
jgi:hypothetical protein